MYNKLIKRFADKLNLKNEIHYSRINSEDAFQKITYKLITGGEYPLIGYTNHEEKIFDVVDSISKNKKTDVNLSSLNCKSANIISTICNIIHIANKNINSLEDSLNIWVDSLFGWIEIFLNEFKINKKYFFKNLKEITVESIEESISN